MLFGPTDPLHFPKYCSLVPIDIKTINIPIHYEPPIPLVAFNNKCGEHTCPSCKHFGLHGSKMTHPPDVSLKYSSVPF